MLKQPLMKLKRTQLKNRNVKQNNANISKFDVINEKSYLPKFNTIEKQQKYMDKLFLDLKLTTFDDWKSISKSNLTKRLSFILTKYYKRDIKQFLSSIYPNYPFSFDNKIKIENSEEIKNKFFCEFIDKLFIKFNLKTLEDWLNISRLKIIQNGGKNMLKNQFKNDMKFLLSSLYPNFPWDFSSYKIKPNFQSIEEQRNKMDELFHKLKLKSHDDWFNIQKGVIEKNGGGKLLYYHYKGNLMKLLTNLYPDYSFSSPKLENNQKFMDNLFIKFNLKSFDDWMNISRTNIMKNGGYSLLLQYNNNMKKILTSIYPNYPWENSIFNFRYNLSPKIKEWIDKYHITQKKDWYRLPGKQSNYRFMYDILKKFYPSEKWKKSEFLLRTKKTTQRLLFASTQKIYPSLLIFENYYHPQLIHSNNLELDIFIPALQLALEYQGQHHYDDIPSRFAAIEASQYRDDLKEKIAKELLIKIIYIPYWWDLTLSSLQSLIKVDILANLEENSRENIIKIGEIKSISLTKQKKFKSIENQKEFMDKLFIKLKLNSIDDWITVSRKTIIQNRGYNLIDVQYKKDLKFLLSSLYPNFPWDFSSYKSKINLQSIEKQRKRMDEIFQKLKLKSHDDWFNIPRKKIIKNGGGSLLNYQYKGNLFLLLTTIYPDKKFNLPTTYGNSFQSIEKQKKFMDKLFIKLKLKSFDDWFNVSRKKIIAKGGKNLIDIKYEGKMNLLLSNIYPNYPWLEPIKKQEKEKNLDELFIDLKLNNLEEWKLIIYSIKNGNFNKQLLKKIGRKTYKNLANILKIKYPNYPWNFNSIKLNEKIKKKQQKFLDKLFIKFNLNSLDELINISKKEIIQNGGRNVILKEYKTDNLKLFFSSLYPNFPWDFSHEVKNNSQLSDHLLDEQRNTMNKLFKKLNLKSHDDWFNIPRKKINTISGGKILYGYYKGDLFKLLTTLYPNHSFSSIQESNEKLKKQREIMDKIFIKLKLKSIDDWLSVPRDQIVRNRGSSLLRYYKGDYSLLLQSIYPYYPISEFNFKALKFKPLHYFNLMENQQEFMDHLFKKFNLKRFDDWILINRVKLKENRGGSLLSKYKRKDMKKILTSIYPNYPWENSNFNLRYNLSPKIKEWIDKYHITQKKDWYRLPHDMNGSLDLYETLKQIYPSEKWKKSNFVMRKKKTSQRLLLSVTQKIYPSLLLIENYFHPKLISTENANMELDIFIPALQLALEYQGQQHYDDMPAAFGGFELLRLRDEAKEQLARDLSIKIVQIPYWWDQSLSSLQSSLQLQ